jgi:hypothetical protein
VLIGHIPGRIRLRGLGHPLFGVAQDCLGGSAAIDVVALPGLLLGQRHSATRHTIFRYLGCHTGGYPGRPTGNHSPDRPTPGST